ncbi:hypothetical protein M409DRAFT_16261 [Zasmidium cellare ATCC 36951]|uniref:Uncharacterized protein n=1 Tax=Zasmidium cellare ATCC 36951 TaxID=1080233 RepID=A0A6A6D6N8_ZASCE|nr:uncharacterized protein M409DRAFT_16261 [Zasmidium cellare ATCC 36951]KAF2173990.1 hypothetical protein M409DRAFT_16261 [Zasmidium cellare ATCC 36951]
MNSFITLHRRVERTRGWLNTMIRQNTSTPIEDLDDAFVDIDFSDESASSFGVQSLSEHTFADEQELIGEADRDDDAQSDTSTVPFSEEECPLCLWLLNRWRFGNSYLSDGTAGYNAQEGAKHLSNARKVAINYEVCGRGDDNTFRDLRSASKARKRKRQEQEKYYFWKGVKPGWLGKQVHNICELDPAGCFCHFRRVPEKKTVTVTKKMMYEKAQLYPRPPTYHHSTKKDHLRAWHASIERAKQERKHSQYPGVDAIYDDFDDRYDYDEPHAGDDYTAFRNDHWDWVRQENWCYICEAPWGQCVGFRSDFEVDHIESIAFETSADGKSWTLRWEPEIRPKENRAPAVLPYTKQDWIAEGYVGLYTDDDA